MLDKAFAQPRLQSSQGHFSKVPAAEIPRSVFDRSHGYKTTFDSGYLIPIYVDEVLPGDTFKMRATTFARLATPLTPFMDNLYADTFFFYVPNRLVWTHWEKFNGAQDNPGDSTSFVVPQMVSTAGTGYLVGSIHDYMGLPTGKAGYTHSALWHRAYNLIYNQYFRDQNLQNSVTINTGDGPDLPTDYTLKRRGKRHDYFTGCLPFTQKGTAVTIPLGTTAPIVTDGQSMRFIGAASGQQAQLLAASSATTTTAQLGVGAGAYTATESFKFNNQGLQADLTNATAATINSLRQAFQIQRLYERDARGGTRYIEILKSHFGVTSPDFRLQRPEYLGGGSTMINTSPIPQTSVTSTTPQGNLTAVGSFSHSGIGFNKSFVEHGVIIGMISVRAELTYQQGLNRMFSRSTRFDFYWPALSHLGEQAVLNKEIYLNADSNDPLVFGYQERYAEYRYKPSQITGQFRSTYSTPLDMWHLAQNFSSLPVLGDTFISETPPISRVIAVPSAPQFLFDAVFNLQCARPMPVYSVPGLIDHF